MPPLAFVAPCCTSVSVGGAGVAPLVVAVVAATGVGSRGAPPRFHEGGSATLLGSAALGLLAGLRSRRASVPTSRRAKKSSFEEEQPDPFAGWDRGGRAGTPSSASSAPPSGLDDLDGDEDDADEGFGGGPVGLEDLERPALYVVATPIGNANDISLRALDVLKHADVIFAEDTRKTLDLLTKLGIQLAGRQIYACHEWNEEKAASNMVNILRGMSAVALVSDAGTPLISDPGFAVLRKVRDELGENFPIRPVPGPCAAVAALSVAGAAAGRYLFAGFPSRNPTKKRREIVQLLRQARAGSPAATLVLYEAPHRLVSTVEAIVDAVEAEGTSRERRLYICRELTKQYETVLRGEARQVLERLEEDKNQRRGEFVLLIEGGAKLSAAAAAAVADAADGEAGDSDGEAADFGDDSEAVGAFDEEDEEEEGDIFQRPPGTRSPPPVARPALRGPPGGAGQKRMSTLEVAKLLAKEMPQRKAMALAAQICSSPTAAAPGIRDLKAVKHALNLDSL
mmetsp:Transcript_37389/g.94909  ORF Transcript_37389/g.94909 Transcript_37389/m.94909 type:complete len:511 (-) Transcript_37389:33-1565(-)